jgi:hypothetical protein
MISGVRSAIYWITGMKTALDSYIAYYEDGTNVRMYAG